MIEKPQITEATPQAAAVIHVTIPREQIRDVMGPGYEEVMAAVKDQGIGPSGPWYTRHLKMTPEVFDFEICVPVSAPVKPVGRVKPGERPGGRVVRTVYHGSYEGLPDGWGEFDAWIEAEGLNAGAGLWEIYAVGPESTDDPAGYRTELYRPL